jgi:STE24 endopeptidase
MKHLLFGALVSLATFYVAFRCVNVGSVELGFEGPNDLAAFPLLGLVSFSLSLVLLPVGNFYSRLLETEADDFAVKATGMRQAFTGALQKLAKVNLADPSPHPLIEFFLYSHPSIAKRVDRVQAADSKIV